MKFYERLKELRNKKGVSQAFLAKKLNVTPGAIAHWELGNRNPDYNTLIKIADYFEVDVNYLIGQRDVSYRQPVDKDELKLADDYFLNVLGYRSDSDFMEQMDDQGKISLYKRSIASGNHSKEDFEKELGIQSDNVISIKEDLLSKLDRFFELFSELDKKGVLEDLNKLSLEDRSMVYSLIKRLEEKNEDSNGV